MKWGTFVWLKWNQLLQNNVEKVNNRIYSYEEVIHSEIRALFPRKYFMVHRFEQELPRFNLSVVDATICCDTVPPFWICYQGARSQKISPRGKVFLKFPTHPHQLSINNKKFCSFFCCCHFIFQIESFP